MTRVNPQTLATAASPSTSCTSKSRRRIRPGDNNNVAVVCTNIPSLSSKSKHQGNGHHFAAIAERGFRNAAATAVSELMQEHGYSRERAVCALLHEISSSGQTANSTRPTDDKIFHTMQQYGIGTNQAVRALVVSSALERASTERGLSIVDAVHELTGKIAQASVNHLATSAVAVEDTAPTQQQVVVPVQVPPPVQVEVAATVTPTPSVEVLRTKSTTAAKHSTGSVNSTSRSAVSGKKFKSNAAKNGKAAKSMGRKRSNDEASSSSSSNKQGAAGLPTKKKEVDTTTKARTRSDSVTEAVNAKLAATTDTDPRNNNYKAALPNASSSSSSSCSATSSTSSPRVSVAIKRGRSEENSDVSNVLSPGSKRTRSA